MNMKFTCKENTASEFATLFSTLNPFGFSKAEFFEAREALEVSTPVFETLRKNDFLYPISAETVLVLDEDGYPTERWRFFYRWAK